MEQVKETICKEVDNISSDLFAICDWLKENPETAYQEYKAREYLSSVLRERGFAVEKAVGNVETAFLARPAGCRPRRPAVVILAEYDALPGIGHGCGHNMIAAAGLGAAIVLKNILADAAGGLAIAGTPAEEGGGGKVKMAEAGVFEEMDAAMMFHPSNLNLPGKNSLGRTKFKLEFFGKTAHASGSPDRGRNALDAIVMAYSAMNSLRQHLRPDGRIHGVITHGGEAPNIIPDYTAGLFYVRAASIQYRAELFDRVGKCAEGAALATGTEVKIEIDFPKLDPIKRNAALESALKANMEALGLSIDEDDGRRGSSDIGNLSHYLPAVHPFLAIVDADSGIPGHSVAFCEATASPRARKVLLNATKMLAMTAYDYLSSEDLRKKTKACFDQAD
ncbi:MAG: M20 family metallopeptidase [Deltaproteobacteria bacterium]|nr:M20 family metallopeptidase [Deltaproteobacteria bacterium]